MQAENPHILRFPNRAGPAAKEHYIPLRRDELVERLAATEGLGEREGQTLRSFAKMLAALLHREHHATLDELKTDYAPFDPDSSDPPKVPGKLDEEFRERVFEKFGSLLERANFRQLTADEIADALEANSRMGLRVDVNLDLFERLEIHVRGDIVGRWEVAGKFGKKQTVEVPLYERLAVIFRLRSDRPLPKGFKPGVITIKLFKNIPQADIETVLPGPKVRMSWLDQAKIFAPTASGLAIAAFKLMKGAVVLAVTGIYGLLVLLGFVGGTVGYGVRSFFGYLNTKEKYQLALTRSLYFQNLDNNAGVLFRILDEAEEQDFREALIAWFVLWREAGSGGFTDRQIDEYAERMLHGWLSQAVDFEICDALSKLRRLGLAEQVGLDRWRATPLPVALVRLERAWNDLNPLRRQSPPAAEQTG